jgi:leucine dehydrogenase
VKWRTGNESLEGKVVAVQGVGAVGYHLVQHLTRDGAKVVVTDIDQENLKRASTDFRGIDVVAPDKIYSVPCDVFAPCAMGAVINDETIPQLKCGIIAGSANNQLADEDKHSVALDAKGILYAPDYVINAGGLINVANELEGYNRERAVQQAASIYNIVTTIYQIARDEKISTTRAANALAERRIARIGRVKGTYTGVQPQKRGRGII